MRGMPAQIQLHQSSFQTCMATNCNSSTKTVG